MIVRSPYWEAPFWAEGGLAVTCKRLDPGTGLHAKTIECRPRRQVSHCLHSRRFGERMRAKLGEVGMPSPDCDPD